MEDRGDALAEFSAADTGDDHGEAQQEEIRTTTGDLMDCPSSSMHKFCLLCKYGSSEDAPTDAHVNTMIKKLEKAIESSRHSLSRVQLVNMVETLYINYIRDAEGFEDDDDWDRDTIEEHLFVHSANSAAERGDSLLSGITQDMLLAARHAFKHMYNKETGLPDPAMSRQALAWTDRLIKADARNMLSAQARKRKEVSDVPTSF